MIALLLFGLIAGTFAAPKFNFGPPQWSPPSFPNYYMPAHPYVNEVFFDSERFWADLSKEMKEVEDTMADLSRRFPICGSSEAIEGNEYKISICLPEYEEKDIVVKVREGLLMVQANHKYRERNYQDVRTLPYNVNVAGNWIYENGILKITFPLKEGAQVLPMSTPIPTSTEHLENMSTTRPDFDVNREEIEPNTNEGIQDVEGGVGRGDLDKENERENK